MREIQYAKIRLPADLGAALAEGEKRLGALSGETYHPVELFFRKFLGCDLGDSLIVDATTLSRPPSTTVLVIVKGPVPRALVPGFDAADFGELCRMLGASSETEIKKVRSLVRPAPTWPYR
jgi:hypothetical protein